MSLMPTGGGDDSEAASLLPKILELQTKLNHLECKGYRNEGDKPPLECKGYRNEGEESHG